MWASVRHRLISGEAPTTALSLERRCAARTRRFLSAAILFIDSLSTQSATTPPSSLAGRNGIYVFSGGADLGARPLEISSFLKGGPIGLRLRASNGHSFTVRVLRARRAPGHSLLSFSGRALTPQSTGTGTVRHAQGTSPHHRKVLCFPAKIMVPLRATQAESKRANTNK
jgi:hypothetical protein